RGEGVKGLASARHLRPPMSMGKGPVKRFSWRHPTALHRHAATELDAMGKESGEHRVDDLAVNIGQAALDAVVVEGEFLVIEAEQVQQRGVQVVNAGRPLGRLVADLVGGAVMEPRLQPRAGHPDGEDELMVVAALAADALSERRPAELAVEQYQRVVEQAARLQVAQQ